MSLKIFDIIPNFQQDSTLGQIDFYDWAAVKPYLRKVPQPVAG